MHGLLHARQLVLRCDGWTGVLGRGQTVDHSIWTVVLDHPPGAWQAVDLLGGRLLR